MAFPSSAQVHERLKQSLEAGEVVSALWSPVWFSEGQEAAPDDWPAGLIEPRRGYRFRPENLALPLIWGTRRQEALSIVDLGCGSGSLLMLAAALARRDGVSKLRLAGIDVQEAMLDRLDRSLKAHGLSATLLHGDLREPAMLEALSAQLGEHKAQLVLANPPFFPESWGRPSSEASTHCSTHALHGDVDDFMAAAATLLSPEGSALVVFDAQRLSALLLAAGRARLAPRRFVFLGDRRQGHEKEAFRVWIELVHGEAIVEHSKQERGTRNEE
ncbi:MAG: methyltransferase domain-containing protein [Myxococcota bacterium]|jgi:tRNA1Val (adenine37-N6)-methyltransferase|nr:methyltransferase domain-containing protein [Myxococcota bacterium]